MTAPTVTLQLVVSPDTQAIAVEACRAQAAARRRAAELASREIMEDHATTQRDIRTGSAHVVRMLDAADRLDEVADQLEHGGSATLAAVVADLEAAGVPTVDDETAAAALLDDEDLDSPHAYEGDAEVCAVCLVPREIHAGSDGDVEDPDTPSANPLDDPAVDLLRELARG